MLKVLENIDQELFLFLNSLHHSCLDQIMWWSSNKYIWIPLYLFVVYLIYRKFKKQFWIPALLLIFLVFISDQSSVHLFKNLIQRLRPCHNTEINQMVHTLNNYCGGKYGFISSHAANGFGLATLTALWIRKKWYTFLIFFWAVLISYSRIYLGVHYPGDILAGALWGALLALILYLSFNRLFYKNKVLN